MAAKSVSETKRVRYLLGLSSPEEREQVAWEYFEKDDAFQEMLAAEDDLVDAYARGKLTVEERRGFEKNFVSSLRGKKRIRFARAFAGAVAETSPTETTVPSTFFQSPGLLRTAMIGVVIVFVAVLSWLVIDRRRMSDELNVLRAEYVALKRSSDTERIKTTETDAKRADPQEQPDEPRPREQVTTHRTRHAPEVAKDHEIAGLKPELVETPISNTSDATLGNTFESKRITELPLNANDVVGLLSLQPGVTSSGFIHGDRANQVNVTLDGVDVNDPQAFPLIPLNASSSVDTTIRIPSSLSWIRFQILLETSAIHEDYSVTVKTTGGRPVTSVDWTEPFTPNQNIIDTPFISTDDLSCGDYVLLLMGREPDGSFVKVAEYSFNVFRY